MAKRIRPVVKRYEQPVVDSRRLTVADALDKVLTVTMAEGYRPRTLKDYRRIWTWFFDYLSASGANVRYIDEVTTDHFREYIADCLTRNLSPVTVNVRVRALKAIFNRLHEEGLIEENPAARVRKLKTDEKAVQPLTEAQFKRLLSVIDKSTFAGLRDYAAILLMYDAGLRVNEVNALEPADVDFDNCVIMLPGAKNKNRKSRAVPISESLAGLLRQLIQETEEYFGSAPRVFTNNYGEPMEPERLRKRMYEYGKAAGLHGIVRVSPHTLRHTFALRFIQSGQSVFALQKILGHASIETTRRYVNLQHDDIVRAHKRFSPLKNISVTDY